MTKVDYTKPIDLKSWGETPAINGRVAIEDDVKNGLAVYYLIEDQDVHKPYNVKLPKLAYLKDENTNKSELVAVIQAETSSNGVLFGYRNINGGIGVCMIGDLIFLDDNEVKKVTGGGK